MPRVSPEEQAALRTQLMRFIASANIPFVVVDNVEFQKFCTMMRGPTFHLPDRHTISDGLLPQLYGALESKFRHVTKGRNATMAMDGWFDAKNDPTLGYGVTVEEKSWLYDLHDTIGERHTIENMVPHAKEKIKDLRDKYEAKVRTVVVDNATNMAGMRRDLIEEQLKDLESAMDELKLTTDTIEKDQKERQVQHLCDNLLVDAYGCSAHLLNLCGQDVSESSTINSVVTVAKYFRNTHAPKSWLLDIGLPRPPLPGETRWNSVADTLEWFIDHWGPLNQQMQIHGGDKTILRLLENIMLKRNAWDLLQLAKELGVNLDRVQRDGCNIAEACEIWLTLGNTAIIKNNAKAKKSIADRSAIVFQSGSFFAANLMDPRYNGKLLNATQTRKAIEFITRQLGLRYPETKDQCVAGLMKFVANGPPLPFTSDTKPSH